MGWVEWTDRLSELVGLATDGRRALLLVPKKGADLSEEGGWELADDVHARLFSGRTSCMSELRKLSRAPAIHSLPLLYLSAWLVRQQEDAHSFWPYFKDAVVRGRMESVYHLGPYLTSLWRNMHRDLGIYRPREGYVHIKWPLAHAGLTDGELKLISRAVVGSCGLSEQPPDMLYAEPEEFLSFLRLLLRRESHLPSRLRRLLGEADATAMVVAELSQRLILRSWPPESVRADEAEEGLAIASPYFRFQDNPPRLDLVLPSGKIDRYTSVEIRCDDTEVRLETSHQGLSPTTQYESHEWQIATVPWSRDMLLTGSGIDNVQIPVRPLYPFGDGHSGAMMFDASSGRYIRRWRPNRRFILVTGAGVPNWAPELFTDIELMSPMSIGGVQLAVLSAIGRDVVTELGYREASILLDRMEEELENSGALVTLPDVNDLIRPEVSLCGGLPLDDDQYPSYLSSGKPDVLVRGIPSEGLTISVFRREDDGRESVVGSVQLSGDTTGPDAVIHLPEIPDGSYVIRGPHEPTYFRLYSATRENRSAEMHIGLRLLCIDPTIASDDIRHFENGGVRIDAWPGASCWLRMVSEAGALAYRVLVGSDGHRIIRASEFDIPPVSRWIRIDATAWLAKSNTIELAVRPYVPTDGWSVHDGHITATVRGAEQGTEYKLSVLSENPLETPTLWQRGLVGVDMTLREMLPYLPENGWVIITGSESDSIWLVGRIGNPARKYSTKDLQEIYNYGSERQELPTRAELADDTLQQMCCVLRTAELARSARIPRDTSPVPSELISIVMNHGVMDSVPIRLSSSWNYGSATLEFPTKVAGTALLCVDGERYRVAPVSQRESAQLQFAEPSPPCLCGDCRRLMTQERWHTHRCTKHSLIVLRTRFRAVQVFDWPSIVRGLTGLLRDAVRKPPEKFPARLEPIWAILQKLFRERRIEDTMSPEEWINGTFLAWQELYRLVNGGEATLDWASVWRSIEGFHGVLIAVGDELR